MIELLIVIAIVAATVSMLSVTLPRAQQAIVDNRRRTIANRIASNRMEEIQSQPYALLQVFPPTDTATPPNSNFPVSGILAYNSSDPVGSQGCDCSRETLSHARYNPRDFEFARVIYRSRACINFVERRGGQWLSYCDNNEVGPSGADKGIKRILVRVYWNNHETGMEGMVTR